MPSFIIKSLKGKKHFEQAFKQCKKVSKNNIVVFFRKRKLLKTEIDDIGNTQNEATKLIVHFAVLIGKKSAKKAVTRNRIKRIMRESLRHAAKSGNYTFLYENIDFIAIAWRGKVTTHPKQIRYCQISSQIFSVFDSIVF